MPPELSNSKLLACATASFAGSVVAREVVGGPSALVTVLIAGAVAAAVAVVTDIWSNPSRRIGPVRQAARPTAVLDGSWGDTAPSLAPRQPETPPAPIDLEAFTAPHPRGPRRQCPACAAFGVVRARPHDFTCRRCRHRWRWDAGDDWPTVRIDPTPDVRS